MFRIFATMIALAVVAPAGASEIPEVPRTLTVGGEAAVGAAPDLAVVRLGATIQQPDAAVAQRRVGEIMSAAMAAIGRAGIAEQDIQTEQLSLNPVYADRRSKPLDDEPDTGPRIVGYRATNTLQIRVHDLSQVGAVLDVGVAAGANELRGMEFQLDDDEAQRLLALRAATQQAQRKAQAVAEAAAVRLGTLQTIREGGQSVERPQFEQRMMMAADAGTPVAPGHVRVRASVTLVYELAD